MGVQCKRTLIGPTVDQNSGDVVSCHSQILKAVKATSIVCLKVTWLPQPLWWDIVPLQTQIDLKYTHQILLAIAMTTIFLPSLLRACTCTLLS